MIVQSVCRISGRGLDTGAGDRSVSSRISGHGVDTRAGVCSTNCRGSSGGTDTGAGDCSWNSRGSDRGADTAAIDCSTNSRGVSEHSEMPALQDEVIDQDLPSQSTVEIPTVQEQMFVSEGLSQNIVENSTAQELVTELEIPSSGAGADVRASAGATCFGDTGAGDRARHARSSDCESRVAIERHELMASKASLEAVCW